MVQDSDEIFFIEEEDSAAGPLLPDASPWKVLVADDDPEVFTVTRLVLSGFVFAGRGVSLLYAGSAAEATEILKQQPDIAVALLDVVMETEDAGLKLVKVIREDLGNSHLRIVLRTGQPGQAPEHDVVMRYDINDYRSKTELTDTKLITTLVSSLRSYQQIEALERSRAELREARDTLEIRVAERTRDLRESEARLRSILDASVFPILVLSEEGDRVRFLNDHAGEALGWALLENNTPTLPDLWENPVDGARLLARTVQRGRVLDCEFRLRGAGGEPFWALVSTIAMSYDGQPAVLLSFNDITVHKQREEAWQRLALTDPLTGLGNRRLLFDRGILEVARARRGCWPLSGLMIDLDHFKRINDTQGHAAGDAILRTLADTLRESLREIDVIARVGGEEFAILLPDTSLTAAQEVGERLRLSCQIPQPVGGPVTISIGISTLHPEDRGLGDMLSRADDALYRAKRNGRDRVEIADDSEGDQGVSP
ncbi:GGDEF domain-containing response regulator [Rhodospirillum rubrum]|uniref:GGDEF domain-containing response regulator n=1 Tax=Rhodospirillum rubrum TaxID=1085 RepID=UPI001907C04B|nr:diguanylate cyclase [Rhodospirillum rubrum]